MDKLKVPETAAPYVEALRGLIRTGAAAAPGLETSCLVDLAVVRQYSGTSATPARRAHTFIMVLQQVARQRLQGKDVTAAMMLFGFEDYAGLPVQDRYRAVAQLYNPYWTWENYRKEPLTRHLLAIYLALEREAELTPDQTGLAVPDAPRNGLVGQDWVMECFEGVYNLPSEPGQPFEALETRRLRAICEEATTWRHYTNWRERGLPGPLETSLFGPGTATEIDAHFNSAMDIWTQVTEVRFPRPVKFGQTIDFTLAKRAQVEFEQMVTGWDWYGLVTLKSPAQSVRLGLRLPQQRRPPAIWRYEDIMSGLIRPGAPQDRSRLVVDPTGFVSCQWSKAAAGYSYGIALQWED